MFYSIIKQPRIGSTEQPRLVGRVEITPQPDGDISTVDLERALSDWGFEFARGRCDDPEVAVSEPERDHGEDHWTIEVFTGRHHSFAATPEAAASRGAFP